MSQPPSSSSRWLSGLLAVSLGVAVYTLDRTSVWLTFLNVPPPWLLVVSAGCIAVGRSPSAWWATAFVAAGLLTLPFSLAPGHTLVNFLWESIYLAAAVILTPLWARVALLSVVAWRGFTHVSALALVGLDASPTLVSYAYGGVAAGLLFPALAMMVRPFQNRAASGWRQVGEVALGLALASMALFVALASGSRAVYLGLGLASIVFCVQARRHRSLGRVLLALAAALTITLGYDALLPGSVVRPLVEQQVGVELQIADVSSPVGNVRWRLAMWRQSLTALVGRPLGTGAGSFTSVIHAYQQFPMLWSTSPHSFIVETAMTGGLLRTGLLAMLLGFALWRAWRDGHDWPWTAAIFAVWVPLLFDVAASNPVYMAAAFAVIAGSAKASPPWRWSVAGVGTALVVVLGALWWYLPCRDSMCSLQRHLGFTASVDAALVDADESTRRELVAGASALYPSTLRWLTHPYTVDLLGPKGQASVLEQFPFASLDLYARAVDALVGEGSCARASELASAGLATLGNYEALFGQARITRDRHAQLVDRLLAATNAETLNCSQD